MVPQQQLLDYRRVARAMSCLDSPRGAPPGPGELAAAIGLSPDALQRTFRRWAGVDPEQLIALLSRERAAALLRARSAALAGAARPETPGAGRLRDPGRRTPRGEGLILRWGLAPSPFGEVVLATSPRGVCMLAFTDGREAAAVVGEPWPAAALRRDAEADLLAARAFGEAGPSIPLAPLGTPFQRAVWRALLDIPPGALSSYGQLARQLGRPRAARAVGRAVGSNPVAWLIPCHRVIAATGALGGYRWGRARKRAILGWEAARSSAQPPAVEPAGVSAEGPQQQR